MRINYRDAIFCAEPRLKRGGVKFLKIVLRDVVRRHRIIAGLRPVGELDIACQDEAFVQQFDGDACPDFKRPLNIKRLGAARRIRYLFPIVIIGDGALIPIFVNAEFYRRDEGNSEADSICHVRQQTYPTADA